MRIDHSEVEFSGNQEDDSTDSGQSREAVGLARLRPGDDPSRVLSPSASWPRRRSLYRPHTRDSDGGTASGRTLI